MASEKTPLLTQLDQIIWERGEGGMERENEERVRVRISHFSIGFPTTCLPNADATRGKVDPTARATHGYQDCKVSTTPEGKGFFLLGLL